MDSFASAEHWSGIAGLRWKPYRMAVASLRQWTRKRTARADQVAVTHPPSGFGGSTPSRRTDN